MGTTILNFQPTEKTLPMLQKKRPPAQRLERASLGAPGGRARRWHVRLDSACGVQPLLKDPRH